MSSIDPAELSVLIVDDGDIRAVIADALRTAGYQVETAANGAEAMTILRTRLPRLILLDLSMPVMSGTEFRQAQMENLELAAIPTIVMTGRPNPGAELAGLSVRGCLAKPIQLPELLRLVEHYCA
jgi:CheY-like chemotaxis protein